MSVLARLRKQAPTEFEMNFARLVKLSVARMDSIPKRYRKFVRPKIMGLTMAAYHDCIMANETDYRTEAGRLERRRLLDHSISLLSKLQKPLVVYWSLRDSKDGGMKEWADTINREIALLNGAAGFKPDERMLPMIRTFDLAYSDDRIFLNKMRDLHKFTYSKICSVPLEYKDHLSDQLLQFVDDALFYVLQGNSDLPQTKKQYETRDSCFKKAISNLNGMQRPLYALWNVMCYSENVMDEWASLINEELKLLQGLRKSDRERFGRLK